MTEQFRYDVFISHSSHDKPAARELAERLRGDGLKVWFDEWEIKPGDAIPRKIQEGLEQSQTLVLLMSQHASASEWVTFEHHSALFRDLSAEANQQRRFIPVRLDDAEIRDALKQFAYVDWRQRSEEQYARLLAACRPADDETERVNEQEGQARSSRVFTGHTSGVWGVAVMSDGQRIVSGSWDNTVRMWELDSGRCLATLKGYTGNIIGIAVTPDGLRVVSSSVSTTMQVSHPGSAPISVKGSRLTKGELRGLTVSNQSSAPTPGWQPTVQVTVQVWEDLGRCFVTLEGHTDDVHGVVMTPDSQRVISYSKDKTVRVWEQGGRLWERGGGYCLAKLEGHTDDVLGVTVTPDGRRVVSCSKDNTVRVWELDTGRCLATLEGHTDNVLGVAVTPDGRQVVSCSIDHTVRVWELLFDDKQAEVSGAGRYTNAKVLLVGESGVGKSGLALRLTEDRFEPTISTDGAAVTRVTDEWATQLRLPHNTSTHDLEREIWLWDFAGQSDYRLIHQLFLDETSLAVLVFNPQADNPFEGLGQWDRDLQRAARRPFKKLLVAGRCDRGALMVSREGIERFRVERDFANYLETSAQTGAGCNELREAIIRNIPWAEIPWTASPHIFRLLKEEIVTLKDEGKVLLRMGELKQQLEMRLLQQALEKGSSAHQLQQPGTAAHPGESFKLEELRAVVGLLVRMLVH